MAETGEVRESAEKMAFPEWWAVPKSSKVVGYRVPVEPDNVSRGPTGNTSTIVLPEELAGRVIAWSATMSVRRGVDWVPIETTGSALDTIDVEESGGRSQKLRVRWRVNPDVAFTELEQDGLACSLLLVVR